MKRFISVSLMTLLLFCLTFSVCAQEDLTDVHCDEQGFATKIPADLTAYWEDGNGLRISVDTPGYVPFVLVWRKNSTEGSGADYLNNEYTQHMKDTYGDNLIGIVQYEYYDIGGKKLPAALFTYRVDGGTLCLLRLEEVRDDQTVQYTAKYVNGDEQAQQDTLEALDAAVRYYQPDEEPGISVTNDQSPEDPSKQRTDRQKNPGDTGREFERIPSEASQINWQSYTDPGGYFTMEIPSGWVVQTGLKPEGTIDLISYAICVSDPSSPDRMLYFNLNCAGMLKSEEARQWFVNTYGPTSPFALSPVATEVSTKGFFEGMTGRYDYTSFQLQENLGKSILGGDMLRADVASSLTGNLAEGLFTAVVMDSSYMVQRNPFNYNEGLVDVGVLTMFDVIMETAPKGEFLDWQPVLEHCLSSISFTDAFLSQRQAAWQQLMGTSEYIMQTAGEISDMIMDTWENRDQTYDILAQKYSDATLGYERVYDTETGEYLKAESGFTDWYDGSRYTPADNDAAYTSPLGGTIYWK